MAIEPGRYKIRKSNRIHIIVESNDNKCKLKMVNMYYFLMCPSLTIRLLHQCIVSIRVPMSCGILIFAFLLKDAKRCCDAKKLDCFNTTMSTIESFIV